MSARVAAALAHSNIAFSKYWGKRLYAGNYPACPSLSLTLDALSTRTRVTFDPALREDRFVLSGKAQTGEPLDRVVRLVERVRAAAKTRDFAEVESTSDFPAASGLASSASGFAALALAAVSALGLDWDRARVSDLARESSASAARSLYGGFVELPAGPVEGAAGLHPAKPLFSEDHVDWRLVVVVVAAGAKAIGSTSGMELTRSRSPYYETWLAIAPPIHEELKAALLSRDLPRFGAKMEESAFAMHASAMAAQVLYMRGATLDVLAAVRALRQGGTLAFATMDAGPHVKVLCRTIDADAVRAALAAVPGVQRAIVARAAEGARLIDPSEVRS
jgi:diphosphomevalonate decarboxylase